MPEPSILVSDGNGWNVGNEVPFPKELDLQEAVAAHPEVLPVGDVGLSKLVTLGTEVVAADNCIVDMLAADRQGRLAIYRVQERPGEH